LEIYREEVFLAMGRQFISRKKEVLGLSICKQISYAIAEEF